MSHERDGLEAGVPGGKDCLSHDSNNPEHHKLSCDDLDEYAGDNGGKDKTQIAKQILHFVGLFGENRPVSKSCFTAEFHRGTDIFVVKGSSLTEHCRYHNGSHLIFGIPIYASLFHVTLISIERFVGMKYTFRYETIATELRLKITVVSSWAIACCPAILQSLSQEFESLSGS